MARPRNVKQVFRGSDGESEEPSFYVKYIQPKKNSVLYNGKLKKKKDNAPWWYYVPVNVSPITGETYESYRTPPNNLTGYNSGVFSDPED